MEIIFNEADIKKAIILYSLKFLGLDFNNEDVTIRRAYEGNEFVQAIVQGKEDKNG